MDLLTLCYLTEIFSSIATRNIPKKGEGAMDQCLELTVSSSVRLEFRRDSGSCNGSD